MITTYSQDSIPSLVASHIVPRLKQFSIITFVGPLGAGKTTLIKEIFRQAGILATITSPTFSYVNRYQNASGLTFYHFDLYRIDSIESFINAGFDEYLKEPNSVCLIEWPEVIHDLLAEKGPQQSVCSISISYDPTDHSHRIFEIKP